MQISIIPEVKDDDRMEGKEHAEQCSAPSPPPPGPGPAPSGVCVWGETFELLTLILRRRAGPAPEEQRETGIEESSRREAARQEEQTQAGGGQERRENILICARACVCMSAAMAPLAPLWRKQNDGRSIAAILAVAGVLSFCCTLLSL